MKVVKIKKDVRWCVNFIGTDFKKDQVISLSDVRAADEMIIVGAAELMKADCKDAIHSDELQKQQAEAAAAVEKDGKDAEVKKLASLENKSGPTEEVAEEQSDKKGKGSDKKGKGK